MPLSYADQTIDSPNPFARYAHRGRLQRALNLALPRIGTSKLLDYGCGSGAFIAELRALKKDAVGYEPFMNERSAPGLPIYSNIDEVSSLGPYGLITLFETIEHLENRQIDEFLATCRKLLSGSGTVLLSAPIEIGPGLLLKEFNRYMRQPRHSRHCGYSWSELLKASLFGIAPEREPGILSNHKGFDFRQVIRCLESRGWCTEILVCSPLPIGMWYGNSQVFFSARFASNQKLAA